MKPEILAQMKLVAEGGLDAPPEVTLELIVEVERLRGIIRWVEQSGGCDHNSCPWCGLGIYGDHADDCPAFTREGEVK